MNRFNINLKDSIIGAACLTLVDTLIGFFEPELGGPHALGTVASWLIPLSASFFFRTIIFLVLAKRNSYYPVKNALSAGLGSIILSAFLSFLIQLPDIAEYLIVIDACSFGLALAIGVAIGKSFSKEKSRPVA